jgi:hypothetical protein
MMATAIGGNTSSSSEKPKRLDFRGAPLEMDDVVEASSLAGSTLTLTSSKHKLTLNGANNTNNNNNNLNSKAYDQASLAESLSHHEKSDQRHVSPPHRRTSRYHFQDVSKSSGRDTNGRRGDNISNKSNDNETTSHNKNRNGIEKNGTFDYDDLETAELISNNESIKSYDKINQHFVRNSANSGETFVPILILAKNKAATVKSSRNSGNSEGMFASNNAKLNYIKQLQESELRNLRNFQYLKRYNGAQHNGSQDGQSIGLDDSAEDLRAKKNSADNLDSKQVWKPYRVFRFGVGV